jgi:hypothetical protein
MKRQKTLHTPWLVDAKAGYVRQKTVLTDIKMYVRSVYKRGDGDYAVTVEAGAVSMAYDVAAESWDKAAEAGRAKFREFIRDLSPAAQRDETHGEQGVIT